MQQESKYFKAENQKSNEHINKLNSEYQQQMLVMSNKDKEKDNVIQILKD